MIPAHRNRLMGQPMSTPVMNLEGKMDSSSAASIALASTFSGCVRLTNLTGFIILMGFICSFLGFGATLGLRKLDSARNGPDAGVDISSHAVDHT